MKLKLIIAGSRHLEVTNFEIFELITHFNLHPTEIVSGMASGIDRCGAFFALKSYIKLTKFPADWEKFGKSAGYRRNKQMAEYADALLLIWDGESRGSGHMKTIMSDLGKPIYEAKVDKK